MRIAILAMILFGCGGKKFDPCEQLVKQMPQIGTVEKCKAQIDDLRKVPNFRCILDATDDDAVVACLRNTAAANRKAVEGDVGAATTDEPPTAAVRSAEAAAQQAINDAKAAKERLDKATRDLDDLSGRLAAAKEAVVAAQNDADRASANAKLRQLQQELADMRARLEAARAAEAKAERAKGVHISPQCLDNPLAKGC